MRPPRPSPWPSSEGRDRRGWKPKEETMHILRMIELLHMTRPELCDLECRDGALRLASGVRRRARATINLLNIRRVLAWRDLAPD